MNDVSMMGHDDAEQNMTRRPHASFEMASYWTGLLSSMVWHRCGWRRGQVVLRATQSPYVQLSCHNMRTARATRSGKGQKMRSLHHKAIATLHYGFTHIQRLSTVIHYILYYDATSVQHGRPDVCVCAGRVEVAPVPCPVCGESR